MFKTKRAYTIVVSRKGESLVEEVEYVLDDFKYESKIGKTINICKCSTSMVYVIETRLSRARFNKLMNRKLGYLYRIDTTRKNLMVIRRYKSKTELY